MNSSIFRKADVFDIFAQIVDDYEDKTILDFGGNRGNLIRSSEGKIKPENYTCLDVSTEALRLCEKENPGVSTIHWDYYHEHYNPDGNPEEKFPYMPQYYDIVFANSVFTHMDICEVMLCLKTLSRYSKQIVFTYIDPNNEQFIQKFRDKYYDLYFEKKPVSYTKGKYGLLWSAFDTNYLMSRIKFTRKVEAGKTSWFNYMVVNCRDPALPVYSFTPWYV